MRIQHNILVINSYRNYTNNTALGKNLEKLSSGYKINRAGAAAGLAISKKMWGQIQGLNAAQKNVKDGISLVKTAEGAMQEIQDMMPRMKYLATQSANGTYDSDVDRVALQDEVDSLISEINRIADSANFNGTKLLNAGRESGSTGGGSIVQTENGTQGTAGDQVGAASFEVNLSALTGWTSGATITLQIGGGTVTSEATGGTAASDLATAFDGATIEIGGISYTIDASSGDGKLVFKETNPASNADGVTAAISASTNVTVTASGGSLSNDTGITTANETAGTFSAGTGTATPTAAKSTINFAGKTGADLIGKTLTFDGTKYQFVADADDADDDATAIVIGEDDAAADIADAVATAIGTSVSGFTATNNGDKVEITENSAQGDTEAASWALSRTVWSTPRTTCPSWPRTSRTPSPPSATPTSPTR